VGVEREKNHVNKTIGGTKNGEYTGYLHMPYLKNLGRKPTPAQPIYLVAISKHLYCRFPASANKNL
jgi:hypothetical protein